MVLKQAAPRFMVQPVVLLGYATLTVKEECAIKKKNTYYLAAG